MSGGTPDQNTAIQEDVVTDYECDSLMPQTMQKYRNITAAGGSFIFSIQAIFSSKS